MRQAAEEIVRTLRHRGHQALLVGGCVRDLLLGREPADYDVATDAVPDEVMRIFPKTYAVGAQFGVVLVPVRDESVCQPERASKPGVEGPPSHIEHPTPPASLVEQTKSHEKVIEVATFRSDGLYTDGRHPDDVRYSKDPREDVRRRDFTINGLLLDPLKNEVLDYVGGQADLRAGVIRTIGSPEQRFSEDKLRMLRGVRFAARFDYTIDVQTFEATRKLAGQIHQVSRERVRDELSKMLTEGRARRAFELLDETGLLGEVLPEIPRMKGVEQPPQFHPEGDVWTHTLLCLEKLPAGCSRTLAWGALLHDVGKPATFRVGADRIRFDGHVEVGVKMAEDICRRLRFSNDDIEQIAALVANHMRFADVMQMRESTFKRFVRLPRFGEHLELHRIDCLSAHGDLTLYHHTRDRVAALAPQQVQPEPLISGDDLIAAGYEPGPHFKEILSAVEDAQLEGSIETKQDAMSLVHSNFPLR